MQRKEKAFPRRGDGCGRSLRSGTCCRGRLSVEIAKGLLFEYNGRERILFFRDSVKEVPGEKAPESFTEIGRKRGLGK